MNETPPVTSASKKWECPQMPQLEVNWDVAIMLTTNIIGFGCIIRVAKGKVIATQQSCFTLTMKPKLA